MSGDRPIHVLMPDVDLANPDSRQPTADETSRRLYQEAQPGLVQIVSDVGKGSGFFVSADGDVVTDAHVILGATSLVAITSDGVRHKATAEKLDDVSDLAEIKVYDLKPGESKALPLGDSSSLRTGDNLYALGYPEGLRPAYISPGKYQQSVSLLSHVDDSEIGSVLAQTTEQGKPDLVAALQRPLDKVRMHVEPGNSGGPVLDSSGKVVGVADYGGPPFPSYTFVTPVNNIKAMLGDHSNKFQFKYGYGATPDALSFDASWWDKGGLLSQFISPYGFLKNSVATLKSDTAQLQKSTTWRDKIKNGLAIAADISMIDGPLTPLGGFVGFLERDMVDAVPNYPVINEIKRSNGDTTPPIEFLKIHRDETE